MVFAAGRPVAQLSIRHDGQDVDTVSAQEISPPHYSLYATDAEAILANEAAYSSVDGHQVQRYIRNPSAEAQRTEDTGLVSADHVESGEVLANLVGRSGYHVDHSDGNSST